MQFLSVSDLSPRFCLVYGYTRRKNLLLLWAKAGRMSENQTQRSKLSDTKGVFVELKRHTVKEFFSGTIFG